MNQDYIIPHPWSIKEEGFDPERVTSSESLFSLGNGQMGQRANFEEQYSGDTFQGSYIAGVYYPDKTRVGWWKNGYPEYFAKVINAPSWIGIDIDINGLPLDLNTCKKVVHFERELDMKEGIYYRRFKAILCNDIEIEVLSTRFLHMTYDHLGAIQYEFTLNQDAEVTVRSYLDGTIQNEDKNWDDQFWHVKPIVEEGENAFLYADTLKTNFQTCTYMNNSICVENKSKEGVFLNDVKDKSVYQASFHVKANERTSVIKYGGYISDRNYPAHTLETVAKEQIQLATSLGFDQLKKEQAAAWEQIWAIADITIEDDAKAQQGIRFNIFHLNQTYSGKDSKLNIGPKGFTGEKYGGSTYWDTEAYCLPFYMATKEHHVARQLLVYRHQHLKKAKENAQKLGFSNGAALYPMVTMNGEECHNEWEITFEEIHRNGAIAFAIYNYVRYTGDEAYVWEQGLDVLVGIARFWHQRANFSTERQQYVILGVTGPNEYENNVNNNWYTNYIAKWCIDYTLSLLNQLEEASPNDYSNRLVEEHLSKDELTQWKDVATNIYLPFDEKHKVYLQQDGFMDKHLQTVDALDRKERPINQHWSWDRILRSPFIKQADTLQGFYFFEDHFTQEELRKHYEFYTPYTVHESSLSPCVHSILAARLGKMEEAYKLYLRTSRLDLDDYNKEVHEGLHITSMAGTWMSIVEGFGGMRIKEGLPAFRPSIPTQWESYSFKVNFRGQILKVTVEQETCHFELMTGESLRFYVGETLHQITEKSRVSIPLAQEAIH